jgi:hypothetical protein
MAGCRKNRSVVCHILYRNPGDCPSPKPIAKARRSNGGAGTSQIAPLRLDVITGRPHERRCQTRLHRRDLRKHRASLRGGPVGRCRHGLLPCRVGLN